MESKLSSHFRKTRLDKGWSLGQLTRLVGYSNVSKGANRIQTFEQGGDIQQDLLMKLATVLEIPQESVEQLVEEDRRQFFAEWSEWANTPIQPYIVLRLMAAIYSHVDLPPEIESVEEAEAFAAELSRSRKMKCCLVLSRKISVWYDFDGRRMFVTEAVPGQPNSPYSRIGNKKFTTKTLDHGLAIQQVSWPQRREIEAR